MLLSVQLETSNLPNEKYFILLLQILLQPAFPAAESLYFTELTPTFTACVVHVCADTLARVCTCGSQQYLSLLLSILFIVVVKRQNQAQK